MDITAALFFYTMEVQPPKNTIIQKEPLFFKCWLTSRDMFSVFSFFWDLVVKSRFNSIRMDLVHPVSAHLQVMVITRVFVYFF